MVAFGIIIILALIPIVHFAGIPFGPFIGGYYGITSVGHNPGSTGRQALVLGSILGAMMLIILAIGAVIVMLVTDFDQTIRVLIWGGVVVFTFYYATMAAFGAWYAGLRAMT